MLKVVRMLGLMLLGESAQGKRQLVVYGKIVVEKE